MICDIHNVPMERKYLSHQKDAKNPIWIEVCPICEQEEAQELSAVYGPAPIKQYWADVSNSVSKDFYLGIFGSTFVPIRSPLPRPMQPIEGPYHEVDVYEMDMTRVTPDQKKRLAEALAKKHGLNIALVEETLNENEVMFVIAANTITTSGPPESNSPQG